ncbi:hypothetical protein F2P56_024461 [Juglans regia]|uniref:Uncharacterized protein LOC108993599 n=2 Tax=Juglans regia TaxID=51240 RepID=A0A2I4EXK2_JUGRE|nr:uncharacterized protein LOC108993599 [Juglans regia]KAF5454824.1 hypothetical protein F2P56_024461 [Juglans regia]
MHHHPLMEISESPDHLLLLKLSQREEDLFGQCIALKQTRLDSIKRELFQLSCFFFIFHGFFSTILFTSSVNSQEEHKQTYKKWWIPGLLSVSTSLVLVFFVQVKLCRYWKVSRQLQWERNDGRSLTRFIQELRMKGASFDLSKEPQSGKRMKSSGVEIKWKSINWCWLHGKKKKLKTKGGFASVGKLTVESSLAQCGSKEGSFKSRDVPLREGRGRDGGTNSALRFVECSREETQRGKLRREMPQTVWFWLNEMVHFQFSTSSPFTHRLNGSTVSSVFYIGNHRQ